MTRPHTLGDQTVNRTSNQTLRIVSALAWEFWACGWPLILMGPVTALFAPGLILTSAIGKHPSEVAVAQSVVSSSAFYWMTVMCLGGLLCVNSFKPKLHYSLPASSFILAAGPMAFAMLTTFVQYAIVAMILNQIANAGWPIWGPGLLAAFLVGWCLAVWWSTSNSLELRCLVWVASFVVLFSAVRQWGPTLSQSTAGFLPSVGGWHILSFALATAACVGIGTFGFARLRRGDGVNLRRLLDRLSGRIRISPSVRTRPFSSQDAAQFWLEWKERGYVLPGWNALVGIAGLIVASCSPMPESPKAGDALVLASGVLPFLAVAPVLVIGFLLGGRSRDFTFGNFNGSRPLSDSQLAAAILRCATTSLISAALVCAAFTTLTVLVVTARQDSGGVSLLYSKPTSWSFWRGLVGRLGAVEHGRVCDFFCSGGPKGACHGGPCGIRRVVGRDHVGSLPVLVRTDPGLFHRLVYPLSLWLCGGVRRELALPSDFRADALPGRRDRSSGVCPPAFPRTAWHVEIQLLALCGFGLIPTPLAAVPLAVYWNRHR